MRALRRVRRDRQRARQQHAAPEGSEPLHHRPRPRTGEARAIPYRLTLDGELLVTDGALISVGNAQSLGGGTRVTPDALLDDGLFDVLVVQPLKRIPFIRLFPSVFEGTHLRDPGEGVPGEAGAIESDGVIAYADGERIGPLPIDIECAPGALRVVLSPKP